MLFNWVLVKFLQQRNWVFTKISAHNLLQQTLSQISPCIIYYIKWWVGNVGIVKFVSWVWLRIKRYQWIYASNLREFFIQFLFESPFEQRYESFSSFIHWKMWANVSVRKFLLCFACNWHLLQVTRHAMTGSMFNVFDRRALQC